MTPVRSPTCSAFVNSRLSSLSSTLQQPFQLPPRLRGVCRHDPSPSCPQTFKSICTCTCSPLTPAFRGKGVLFLFLPCLSPPRLRPFFIGPLFSIFNVYSTGFSSTVCKMCQVSSTLKKNLSLCLLTFSAILLPSCLSLPFSTSAIRLGCRDLKQPLGRLTTVSPAATPLDSVLPSLCSAQVCI